MNNCSFQECDREEYCKSLCKSHYYMLKKKGILTSIKQRNTNYNYIKCNTNGCNNKHKAKGFCKLHYNRFLKNGHTNLIRRTLVKNSTCTVENCYDTCRSNNMCSKHYQRFKRNGHTDALMKNKKNNLGYMYFESKEKNNLIIDEIEFLNEEFKKETNKYSE